LLLFQQLPTQGRKADLIKRIQEVNPMGEWMNEAVRYSTGEENTEEEGEDANVGWTMIDDQDDREVNLIKRERELLRRENMLLRLENERLRTSPDSSASTNLRTTMSIKSISELVGEYNESEEDFERWRTQINLLRTTYELNENAAKILVGSRLRGKALEWYHSRADHLAMTVDELLKEMQSMFERPMRRLDLRKKFETRGWQKNELFSEYCHHKLILGNWEPIAKEEMIDYIIDRIPSETLRNQAQMHLFSSVQEIMQAFNKITLK